VVTVQQSNNPEIHMNDSQQAQPGSRARPESPVKKKPYQKPEFRRDRVFETTALACGKIQATQSQCKFNRKLA
jgi:hypothetical protein